MENQQISRFQHIFRTRLDTLNHLLDMAESHFANATEPILEKRLAPDMFPFGTQIAFTCNQPRNFSLWCLGRKVENLNPQVESFAQARGYLAETLALLDDISVGDAQLTQLKRIDLGATLYAEMSGLDYLHEFLLPNFYFHLTTAYAILRMAGAPVGKGDFMRHMAPFLNCVQAQPNLESENRPAS